MVLFDASFIYNGRVYGPSDLQGEWGKIKYSSNFLVLELSILVI